jgi:hypothetical protein
MDEQTRDHSKFTRHMDAGACIHDSKCIAFNSCLQQLVMNAVGKQCNKCQAQVTFSFSMRGTCFLATWTCGGTGRDHNRGSWASQPLLHGMYAGNLLLPACLDLSGNSYTKIALMFSFMKMKFVSEANFYRYCTWNVSLLWCVCPENFM